MNETEIVKSSPFGVEGIFREQDTLHEIVAKGKNLSHPITRQAALAIGGMAIYGLTMGAWSSIPQAISSAIKLPLLFCLSLAVTLPAFHFISLYMGSRLRVTQTLTIITNGAAVMGVLTAAFAPISAFFMFTGSSYSFLILLHTGIMAFCGIAGVSTMQRNIRKIAEEVDSSNTAISSTCFVIWASLFGFVGSQLAYTIRPFVGAGSEFMLLNPERGNFFVAVFRTLYGFLTGG